MTKSDNNIIIIVYIHLSPFLYSRAIRPPVTTGPFIIQTPEILLGGVPSSFVQPSSLDFTTFRGCLHDFSYSTTEGSPVIINPVDSIDDQYAIL